jgi:hypothetical protein
VPVPGESEPAKGEPLKARSRRARALLHDLMREVVAVGRAQGVELAYDHADTATGIADGAAEELFASMYHDLKRGNSLEVRGPPPGACGEVIAERCDIPD